jgi:hypothetical protein
MTVPESILLEFFEKATNALKQCPKISEEDSVVDAPSFANLRMQLLNLQKECLVDVIQDYSENRKTHRMTESGGSLTFAQVQETLQHLQKDEKTLSDSLKKAMEEMNDEARLAFCRLVLRSECCWAGKRGNRQLKASGMMQREDILEFCGLCNASVRLPAVQEHLQTGAPLFPDVEKSSSNIVFPQKRLQAIQRMFLQFLGYDADFGTLEIQRIFFNDVSKSEYADDQQLIQIFATTAGHMNAVLQNANLAASQVTLSSLCSDQDQGGVTRVVSIHCSEKLVDQQTGEELAVVESDAPPEGQTMQEPEEEAESQQNDHSQEKQRKELRIAREAAALQQEILGELLAMSEEERDKRLIVAQEAVEDFSRKAMEVPPGPERIALLRSIDPEAQRLMATHKLWTTMLAANGGKPPVLR